MLMGLLCGLFGQTKVLPVSGAFVDSREMHVQFSFSFFNSLLFIFKAADQKPVTLVVAVPVHASVVVIQVPVPAARSVALGGRPEGGGEAKFVEAPTVVTVATRKGREPTGVGRSGIRTFPVAGSSFFQLTTDCARTSPPNGVSFRIAHT